MKLFKTRYRIVTDRYLGYEVQSRRWWFPFWIQCSDDRYYCANTHHSVDAAKAFIERRLTQNKVVIEYNPQCGFEEVKDYMKKSKNTISDWLDKYGDPEIDKKVEEELKQVITLDDTKIIKTEPRYLCEACFKQKCNCNKTFKRFINWIKGIRTKLYS